MNSALVSAAGLILALGAVHSILGERYILIRLFRRSDLPKLFGSDLFTRRTLPFAWHLTTLAWLGFAALLVAVARTGSGTLALPDIGALVSATSLASAVATFMGSRGRHLAWLVFLAISALVWFGTH